MDPETQRLFTVALIGLLLFFPVFNQVARTAVDALTDAEHKAQLDDFFKSWDQIPDDRKLEYWDGRNPPPQHWQDGEPPDDVTTRGGTDGNGSEGGGNEGEGEGEEGEEGEEEQIEMVEEVLWTFEGGAVAEDQREDLPVNDYHWVNITWSYETFSGHADFQLIVSGEEAWREEVGSSEIPTLFASDNDTEALEDVGTAPMEILYDYDPVNSPTHFTVTITGTYPVVRGG